MTAVTPPIAPMLARLTRELPRGPFSYEPKWDGFRCLAFVGGTDVDLRSRHDRPLARYFPEVVAGLRTLLASPGDSVVLDGEILLARRPADGNGRDRGVAAEPPFALLMARLHPAASRVERLARETPARYVAFDLLADDGADLREVAFVDRRTALERRFRSAPSAAVGITPSTRDPDVALRWLDAGAPDIDGVVAKRDDLRYLPGKRAMVKVKLERTADCIVAGLRVFADGTVSSLLLGVYDDAGVLRHIGAVIQLSRDDRARLLRELGPLAIPIDDHPWRDGFAIGASPLGRLKGSAARWTPDLELDWLPLRPERVVEVGFDRVDGDRFRHPARLVRWRPDRTPGSCRLDQVLAPAGSADGIVADRS